MRTTGEDVTGQDSARPPDRDADAAARTDGDPPPARTPSPGDPVTDGAASAGAGDGGATRDAASGTGGPGAGVRDPAVPGSASAAPGGAGPGGAVSGGSGPEASVPRGATPDSGGGAAAESRARPAERSRRVGRPRFRTALVLAVVLALAGGALQVLAGRARHVPATRNRALVDAETTALVIGDVGNGLSKVFSYAPGSTAATEQAAGEVLGGAALSEYRTLFAQVKRRAAAEGLTVTTHVVRAGVTSLSGRTAHVLVFLDQVVVRTDRPRGTPAAAQLSVIARLDAGHWRIMDIHAL